MENLTPYFFLALILVLLVFVSYQENYGNPGQFLEAGCLADDISYGNPISYSGLHYPIRCLNCNYPASTRYQTKLPRGERLKMSKWCRTPQSLLMH